MRSHRVKVRVTDGHMIDHLPPRRRQRTIEVGTTATIPTLPWVPHPSRVCEPDVGNWTPELSHRQKRRETHVAYFNITWLMRFTFNQHLCVWIAAGRQFHPEMLDIPVRCTQRLLMPKVFVTIKHVYYTNIPAHEKLR